MDVMAPTLQELNRVMSIDTRAADAETLAEAVAVLEHRLTLIPEGAPARAPYVERLAIVQGAQRRASAEYVVEAQAEDGTWRKVRGCEGGPWNTQGRAERIAWGREAAPPRSSSSEGRPHRVTERPRR